MRYNDIVITSRHNPLICEVSALLKKRERESAGRFIIDGAKLCCEYIRLIGAPVYLFLCESYKNRYDGMLRALEEETGAQLFVTVVSDGAFTKLTEQKAPDGIIAVGESERLGYELLDCSGSYDFASERIIALCSLRDTGNVGTVLRTALALGYDRVLLSSDCADLLSPKTLRASMGAVFAIKVSVCEDLCDAVSFVRAAGRRVFCAELRENSLPLESIALSATDVFIVGNEGHGITPEVSAASNGSVYIPISEQSESLNAAVAASILMWHQRTTTF